MKRFRTALLLVVTGPFASLLTGESGIAATELTYTLAASTDKLNGPSDHHVGSGRSVDDRRCVAGERQSVGAISARGARFKGRD